MRRRLAKGAVIVGVLGMTLAACGGDDDTDSSSDDTEDTGDSDESDDGASEDSGDSDDGGDSDDAEDTGDAGDSDDAEDTGDGGDSDDAEDTGDAGSDEAPARAEELIIANNSAPITLDPAGAGQGNASQMYITLAYDPLIANGPDGGLAPGLAESWEYTSDDNMTFEVTLREGLMFADGTPLEAEQVVNSLQYFKEEGDSNTNNLSFAVGDDPLTVVITSEGPNPIIPTLLTSKYMAGHIISPAGVADLDALANQTFGAGPYVLDPDETITGDTYVYVPNENYYDPSRIRFDKVTVRAIADDVSIGEALRSGQVDFIEASPQLADSFAGEDGFEVAKSAVNWDGLYILDRDGTIMPALGDIRVRQALNYAIDREAIVAAVYGDYGRPNQLPQVPGDETLGWTEEANATYTYDPDMARELLAEAGYGDGIEFTCLYKVNIVEEARMMEAVTGQLSEIGVNLTLKPEQNTSAWIDALQSLEYPCTAQTTSARPAAIMVPFLFGEGGPLNVFNAVDPDVQAAFEALMNAGPDESAQAAADAITAAVDKALMAPVVAVDDIFIYNSDRLSGVDFLGGTPTLAQPQYWDPAG